MRSIGRSNIWFSPLDPAFSTTAITAPSTTFHATLQGECVHDDANLGCAPQAASPPHIIPTPGISSVKGRENSQ